METIYIDNKEFVEITNTAAKDILPNTYYICRDGTIYSKLSNRFIHGSVNCDNYRVINMKLFDGRHETFYLHRLLMITFHYTENYKSLVVNHLDGSKSNNDSIDNFEWTDISGNNKHAKENGLLCIGEDCPWAKLTEKQVEEICFRLENDAYLTLNDLAKEYQCNRGIIRDIAVGNTWTHISSKYNIQYVPRQRPKK